MIFDELTEVLDPQPHAAALNMAIDEILLEKASVPTLRIYGWERPAVSFGYFGKFADVAALWPERAWVRRWTGGGIVPHGEDLTYTVIVPRACEFFQVRPVESYERIHAVLAEALGMAAADVRLAPAAAPKVSNACFENPAQFDVLADGRKIAGAAQRRTRHGLLHQGSVQMEGMGSREAATVLASRLAAAMGRKIVRRDLAVDEMEQAERLAAAKYGQEEWLRRF